MVVCTEITKGDQGSYYVSDLEDTAVVLASFSSYLRTEIYQSLASRNYTNQSQERGQSRGIHRWGNAVEGVRVITDMEHMEHGVMGWYCFRDCHD